MATKLFCDACGNEIKSSHRNKYSYLCHIDFITSGRYMDGFVDSDGNQTSQRPVEVDLCNKCYNKVVTPSVVKLKEIQKGE